MHFCRDQDKILGLRRVSMRMTECQGCQTETRCILILGTGHPRLCFGTNCFKEAALSQLAFYQALRSLVVRPNTGDFETRLLNDASPVVL